MRDYKKSLDYLIGAYVPDDITYNEIKEIDGENCAKHYMNLKKLVDKKEKYKWHDLRKNPEDLPKENGLFICVERIYSWGYCDEYTYRAVAKIEEYTDDRGAKRTPIAWKEIEQFEV